MSRGLVTPVQHPVRRPRGHRDVPRNYDSRAKHPGVESYFFFVALSTSGGWCREEKETGLLTYTVLVDVEDRRDGEKGWIREEMICGGVGARVTDSSFRFPPDLSPLPRKRFACLKMDAQVGAGRHRAELLNETRRRIEPRECHNYQGSRASLPLSTLRSLSSS